MAENRRVRFNARNTMRAFQANSILRIALQAGLLLTLAGCSSKQPDTTSLIDAISKAVGVALPPDTTILAYHHQHDDKDDSQCSQLWIVKASVPLAGPDRRASQSRAKSPFKSLKLLVEQATKGNVVIEAADGNPCECIEWRHQETMCRLRQSKTRDGWVAAVEAVASQ